MGNSKADGTTWRIRSRYSDFRKLCGTIDKADRESRPSFSEYLCQEDKNKLYTFWMKTSKLFPIQHFRSCQGDRLERRREMLELWLPTVLEFMCEWCRCSKAPPGAEALTTFLVCHEHIHPFVPLPGLETTPQVDSHSSTAHLEQQRPAEVSMPTLSASAPPLMPSFSASAHGLRQD